MGINLISFFLTKEQCFHHKSKSDHSSVFQGFIPISRMISLSIVICDNPLLYLWSTYQMLTNTT